MAADIKQTLRKDKPYIFVPLIEKCEKFKHNSRFNGPDRYSGKLIFDMLTVTPIAIRSGHLVGKNINEELSYAIYRRNNQVVIPGSSLKGVLRSVFEAISPCCAPKQPGKGNFSRLLPTENQKSCDNINSLCSGCSVFGMVNGNSAWKGKVRISELKTKTGSADLTEDRYIPSLNAPFRDYPKKGGSYTAIGGMKECGNERLYYFIYSDRRYERMRK